MTSRNENLTKFSNWLSPNQSKLEMIAIAAGVAALFMRAEQIPSMNILLTVSLSALAVLFFISSFSAPPEDFTAMDLFAKKLLTWGSSLATIGMLFILQNWKEPFQIIFAGCAVLVFGIVISYMKSEGRISLTKPILVLTLALALFFTPKEKLIKLNLIQAHSVANFQPN